MMKRRWLGLLFITLFVNGCVTDNELTVRPISWTEQQRYFKRVRDPRIFGLHLYNTPSGVEIRGGGRLHPNQGEMQEMLVAEPMRPVVYMRSAMGQELPVLLDPASASSWMEFSAAHSLKARPVGEREAQRVRIPGEEITGCLSLVPTLRLGQFHIENTLVYVRMADGPLGAPARGIEEPVLKGVIGWDVLKNLEQVRFLYSAGQVLLFSTERYEPDPSRLIAELPLVRHAGVCAVRARIGGAAAFVVIDPAGDFEATGFDGTLNLAPGLSFQGEGSGTARIGAAGLSRYNVTLCPQAGKMFFEKRLEL